MKKFRTLLKITLLIILIIALSVLCKNLFFAEDFDVNENDFVPATVTGIVDGDTIWAKWDEYPNGIKIRYIGIDTPESVNPDETKNTPEGKLAADRNAEIIKAAGSKIYLEFDLATTDSYGRVLAYVYIKENEKYVMVQDILLSEGLARIMTVQPNSKYSDHFYELQKDARDNSIGLWKDFFY